MAKKVEEVVEVAPKTQKVEFEATVPLIKDVLMWKNIAGASEHLNFLGVDGFNSVTVVITSKPGQNVKVSVESAR
jgi:hypothetical protein